jgi:hypothetical protein
MLARPLDRALVGVVAAVALAGLVAELGDFLLGWPPSVALSLSLSYEHNLPSWLASGLLLLASASLFVCAERARSDRARWAALGVVFALASLDEAVELHEGLGVLYAGSGALHFGWVIPGAAIALAVGLSFLGFLRRLPRIDRRRFVIAAALFLGGALGMELPLGLWTETHGDQNLGYGVIDWIEETLELAGSTFFVLALRARLRRGDSTDATPNDPASLHVAEHETPFEREPNPAGASAAPNEANPSGASSPPPSPSEAPS